MLKSLGVLVLVVGAFSAVPVRADDFAPVKCGTNQERVWVYASLTTFDVQAQIRCGENVQIIGRVKGYVRVRTKNGAEGYVADSSLPNLLPLEDNSAKPTDVNAPAAADSLGDIARRLAANPETAASRPAETSSAISNPASSHATAINPGAAGVVNIPQPASAKAVPTTVPATINVPAAPAVAKATVAAPPPTTVAAAPSVPAAANVPVPAPARAAVATPARTTIAAAPVVPAASPVAVAATPISTTTAPKAATTASVEAPRPVAAPNAATVSAPTSPATPPKPIYSGSGRAVPASAKTKSGNSAQPPVINANAAPPPSSAAPTVPVMPKLAPPAAVEVAANVPASSPTRGASAMRKVSATPDSEDFTDFQPISESEDPACQIYFSAYGLAPSQIKWIAQNRKKEFPSVCPAPDPSKVDFVVIFTHDFATYSSTLPTPVHTDRNGFSDFSATVGVDTAALSNDDADRAHRQFVWVFTMQRGAFDPATFSPRRRYQFTKMEAGSKASVKSIEDAFEFFAQQASSR